jgi:hypothetical protein
VLVALTLSELRARVLALRLPPEDLLIHGSGPLLAHGLIQTVNDVDIVAAGAAWAKAQDLGPVERAPGGDPVVRLGDVDVFGGWLGEPASELLTRREWVDGLPVASLPDVLAFKRRLNRPKDAAHIRLLEAHLAAQPPR